MYSIVYIAREKERKSQKNILDKRIIAAIAIIKGEKTP
jgi:hypothetical protein